MSKYYKTYKRVLSNNRVYVMRKRFILPDEVMFWDYIHGMLTKSSESEADRILSYLQEQEDATKRVTMTIQKGKDSE